MLRFMNSTTFAGINASTSLEPSSTRARRPASQIALKDSSMSHCSSPTDLPKCLRKEVECTEDLILYLFRYTHDIKALLTQLNSVNDLCYRSTVSSSQRTQNGLVACIDSYGTVFTRIGKSGPEVSISTMLIRKY